MISSKEERIVLSGSNDHNLWAKVVFPAPGSPTKSQSPPDVFLNSVSIALMVNLLPVIAIFYHRFLFLLQIIPKTINHFIQ